MHKYPLLGEERQDGQSKKVWVVPIDQYVCIDPKQYFITTGEATVKIDVVINDVSELLKSLKKLKKQLEKVKDDADYLETAWDNGDLVVKQKYKRTRR